MEISMSKIDQALDDADLDSDAVRFDYSGRGMYGRTCAGITCKHAEFRRFLIALSHLGRDGYLAAMEMADAGTDSMGRDDTIFYWRNLKVTD